MDSPHEVDVLTCAEVLSTIYDDLSGVTTEEATKSFEEWLNHYHALFYPVCANSELAVCKAVLWAIAGGAKIVVMADPEEDEEDETETS